MSTGRETHNIFFYIKWKDYKKAWYFITHFDKLTYEDTIMPIVCKIKGHVAFQPDAKYEPNDWACKRCHRYIHNYNPRKEKLKKLKKVK